MEMSGQGPPFPSQQPPPRPPPPHQQQQLPQQQLQQQQPQQQHSSYPPRPMLQGQAVGAMPPNQQLIPTRRILHGNEIFHLPMDLLQSVIPTRRILHGNEIFHLPMDLLQSRELFCDVLRPELWDELAPEDKKRLKELLPVKSDAGDEEVAGVAKAALDPDRNFCFGSALHRAHQKLADGWLNADGPCEAKQLRDNARLAYDHMIRRYHIDLLKKLLTSRRKLLEATAAVPVDERPRLPIPSSPQEIAKHARNDRLRRRAAKRSRMMLSEVSQGAGDRGDLSSDDEDLANAPPKLVIGAVGEPTLNVPGNNDLHLYQPLEPADLGTMLREHRLLKATQPDHPVLELSDISLEDVIERAGLEQMAEKVGLPVKHPSRNTRKCFPSPSAGKK